MLRSHAGCDACVVYANAAKRISSKNYVQVWDPFSARSALRMGDFSINSQHARHAPHHQALNIQT